MEKEQGTGAEPLKSAALLGIDVTPEDYVVGVWFVGGPRTDWLAVVVEKEGTLYGAYRHRYYDPEDPENDAFSGKDLKHHYDLVPIPDCPEAREKIVAAMNLIQSVGGRVLGTRTQSARFEGGSMDEVIDWLKEQPFAHMKELPPEKVH